MVFIFFPSKKHSTKLFGFKQQKPLSLVYANEEFIGKIWGKSQIPRKVDIPDLRKSRSGRLRSEALKLSLFLNINVLYFCAFLEIQGLNTFPGNLSALIRAMEPALSLQRLGALY